MGEITSRERQILTLLENKKVIYVNEICEKLYISQATARRALNTLEQKDLILRTYGGATLKTSLAEKRTPLIIREKEASSVKKLLAKKASELLFDGAVIGLDASTTAYCLLPYLEKYKDLIVITSGVKAAYTLSEMRIKSFCTGGKLINESYSLIGVNAINMIKNFNFDFFFFSCSALSKDGYLTDTSSHENDIRKAFMKNSAKNIAIIDSGKLGKKHWNNLCHIDDIDKVYCDADIKIID